MASSWIQAPEMGVGTLPSLTQPATKNTARMSARSAREEPPSVAEELKAEMQLLGWHRVTNEAALRTALIRTKQVKQTEKGRGGPRSFLAIDNREEWIQQVVEDEASKPLQVSKEFVKQLQDKEKEEEDRLDHVVQTHIGSLKKLKEDIKMREDQKERNLKYRERLSTFKRLPLGAKVSDNQEKEKDEKRNPEDAAKAALSSLDPAKGVHADPAESSPSITGSLAKLVSLEQRITMLESAKEERDTVKFQKKKLDTTVAAPSRVVYSVTASKKGEKKSTLPALKNTKPTVKKKPATQSSSGTFLTALPEVAPPRKKKLSELEKRQKEKEDKKARVQEKTQRQDNVINRWLDQKKTRTSGKPAAVRTTKVVQRVTKGAASGKKTGNKHMQQFQEMKSSYQAKKEKMNRMPLTDSRRKPLGSSPTKKAVAPSTRSTAAAGRTTGGGKSVSTSSQGRVTVAKIKVSTLSRKPNNLSSNRTGNARSGSLGGSSATGPSKATFSRRTLTVKPSALRKL